MRIYYQYYLSLSYSGLYMIFNLSSSNKLGIINLINICLIKPREGKIPCTTKSVIQIARSLLQWVVWGGQYSECRRAGQLAFKSVWKTQLRLRRSDRLRLISGTVELSLGARHADCQVWLMTSQSSMYLRTQHVNCWVIGIVKKNICLQLL